MKQYWEEAIAFFTDKGVTRELAITYIIVSAVLVVMAFYSPERINVIALNRKVSEVPDYPPG